MGRGAFSLRVDAAGRGIGAGGGEGQWQPLKARPPPRRALTRRPLPSFFILRGLTARGGAISACSRGSRDRQSETDLRRPRESP